MNVHTHYVQKAAPACCPIPNARIRQTHRGIDRAHVHDADFQKSAQPRRVRPLRKDASDLRQSETHDNYFAVAEFPSSSGCHDFRREHFRHISLSSAFWFEVRSDGAYQRWNDIFKRDSVHPSIGAPGNHSSS
jgi:hypothetical protein